jgi:hypothetical protein
MDMEELTNRSNLWFIRHIKWLSRVIVLFRNPLLLWQHISIDWESCILWSKYIPFESIFMSCFTRQWHSGQGKGLLFSHYIQTGYGSPAFCGSFSGSEIVEAWSKTYFLLLTYVPLCCGTFAERKFCFLVIILYPFFSYYSTSVHYSRYCHVINTSYVYTLCRRDMKCI